MFRVTAQTPALLSLEGTRALTVCPGGSTEAGAGGVGPLPARPHTPFPLSPPGSVQPLDSQSLRASSSVGSEPGRLLYRVLRGPRLGRLLHSQRGPGEALRNFTQAEVSSWPPRPSTRLGAGLQGITAWGLQGVPGFDEVWRGVWSCSPGASPLRPPPPPRAVGQLWGRGRPAGGALAAATADEWERGGWLWAGQVTGLLLIAYQKYLFLRWRR